MDKKSIILAALASGDESYFSPAQIQKLLFLIDKKISKVVNGPHFDFRPYHYGPFDHNVYRVLEDLEKNNLIESVGEPERSWKRYRLTTNGQKEGEKILSAIDEKGRKFIIETTKTILSLSFSGLLATIYKAYPEMKENSVF